MHLLDFLLNCMHANERTGFIKSGEILDDMSNN